MEKRNFLGTAVLVGMLTGHTKNGLNLINAPALAKDAGIEVSQSYEGHSDAPTVTVRVSQGKSISHSLQGMLIVQQQLCPLLCSMITFGCTMFNSYHSTSHVLCYTV